MKFDAENQHAEAFKCRGFDGFYNVGGDESAAPVEGETTTKLGGLVAKGSDFAKSEKGQAAIAGAKTLLSLGQNLKAKRNPDEEVLSKCGRKPFLKKKKNAWNKCREETLAARAAAAASSASTPPDNSASTPPDNSIITGGAGNQQRSQKATDAPKPTFDWKKNWWVLPLGLGVLYLGYTKFIKKN